MSSSITPSFEHEAHVLVLDHTWVRDDTDADLNMEMPKYAGREHNAIISNVDELEAGKIKDGNRLAAIERHAIVSNLKMTSDKLHYTWDHYNQDDPVNEQDTIHIENGMNHESKGLNSNRITDETKHLLSPDERNLLDRIKLVFEPTPST